MVVDFSLLLFHSFYALFFMSVPVLSNGQDGEGVDLDSLVNSCDKELKLMDARFGDPRSAAVGGGERRILWRRAQSLREVGVRILTTKLENCTSMGLLEASGASRRTVSSSNSRGLGRRIRTNSTFRCCMGELSQLSFSFVNYPTFSLFLGFVWPSDAVDSVRKSGLYA